GALADRRRSRGPSGDDPPRAAKDHAARGGPAGAPMSRRARLVVFATGALGFAALLLWAMTGLPAFGDFDGRYGQLLAHLTVPERKATSSIAVTTFDFRGVDTLGEEFILFAAAVGVLVLLRIQRADEEVAAEPAGSRRPTAQSATLRSLATALAG